jgi:hypothetical protein
MDRSDNLPDINRLSIVSGVIILLYAMIPFVDFPSLPIRINLFSIVFNYDLDFTSMISILVAGLAASGSDWILQSHPTRVSRPLLRHGFIPALTAWVIGVPLNSVSVGAEWWAVLALGGLLLILVFIAEYIVVNPHSAAHVPASMGLTAVSFALYLTLAITVRAAGMRLFLLLPTLVISLFLLILRSINLRLPLGRWNYYWSAGIAIFVGQLVLGLHYLPLNPLAFGLIIVAIAYSLTLFAENLEEGMLGRNLWVEPLFIFLIVTFMAFVFKV